MKRFRIATAWLLVGSVLLASCSTRRMTAWDLSRPGWRAREIAAVWKPGAGAPELPGELMIATRTDGSRLVQFSKQGLPVVTARSGPDGWEIGSSFRKKNHGGKGRPPRGVLWFLIDDFPPSNQPAAGWTLSLEKDGRWILEDSKRGERLEAVP